MGKPRMSRPSTPTPRRGRPLPAFVSSPNQRETSFRMFVDDSCVIQKDHGMMMTDIKEGKELLNEVKSVAVAQLAMMDKMLALNSPRRTDGAEMSSAVASTTSTTSRISSPATTLSSCAPSIPPAAHYHYPAAGGYPAPPACPPVYQPTYLPNPMPVYLPQSNDACHTIHRLASGVMVDTSGHPVVMAPSCEMRTCSGEVFRPAGEVDGGKSNTVESSKDGKVMGNIVGQLGQLVGKAAEKDAEKKLEDEMGPEWDAKTEDEMNPPKKRKKEDAGQDFNAPKL